MRVVPRHREPIDPIGNGGHGGAYVPRIVSAFASHCLPSRCPTFAARVQPLSGRLDAIFPSLFKAPSNLANLSNLK